MLARSHLMELAFDRKIIPLYESASPAFQEAVHVAAGLALDVPDGLLTYGLVGDLDRRRERARAARRRAARASRCSASPPGLALLAGFLGYALRLRPLLVLSIGAGGFVLVPAWFVWAGVRLRGSAGKAPAV